jgi:hypothetical protein
MAASVKVIDRGFNALQEKYKTAQKGVFVAVGVQGERAAEKHNAGEEGTESDQTNVEIGATHEFGSSDGRIPERSHWRAVLDANIDRYGQQLDKIAAAFIKGIDPKAELGFLGEVYKREVLEFLKAGIEARDIVRHLHKLGQYWDSFSVELRSEAGGEEAE